MGNVSDAMKRYEQEQRRKAAEKAAQLSESQPDEMVEVPDSDQPAGDAKPRSLAEMVEMPDSADTAPPSRKDLPEATPLVPPTRSAANPIRSPMDEGKFAACLKAHHDRGGSVTEEYRTLRTSLLAQSSDERFCYMITSANPGEGKTVTSVNLALVMAERTDMTTVLVDCDLRKRTMAGLLGCPPAPGVAEILQGKAGIEECIQSTCYPNLFVIPAGDAHFSKVGEITIGHELEELVRRVRRTYDYAIFDAPPINGLSDAGMLGRTVGEALVVVQMNKTKRESVDKAIRLLHAANIKVSGMVLTHRKYHIPSYIYRYA
ncbi:MAG: CpsD/CapB family tyrosine-protein kinase [Phycisphaerae bacterium]